MKRHEKKSAITREMFTEALSDPICVDKLLEKDEKLIDYAWSDIDDHRACAFLCRAARKKAYKERIETLLKNSGSEHLEKVLHSENPKQRKNTAKLIGTLADPQYTDSLIALLESESVRMVLPSVILALGAVKTEKAHEALLNYKIKPAQDETELKHESEEKAAMKKALSSYSECEKHSFTDFSKLSEIQLICASPMGRYVAEDCKACGIEVLTFGDTSVTVRESSAEKLQKVRSYREILIPLCKKGSALHGLRDKMLTVLYNTHEKSDDAFRYRMEYRGKADRQKEIKRINSLIECKELENSVSDYEAEVRVFDDGSARLKLFTYADTRFDYRKAALPASIAPANAASVMSYARKYLKDDAFVLDMCCGSGTMLFERDKAKKCRRIMGVDITEKAILAAKENAKLANPKALFYHADCTRFTLNASVDEIISNLPFGNRVGTHTDNENLYTKIFDKMQEWLKVGGIAILYTMEAHLLLSQIKAHARFELLDMIKTEAGGLMPAVAIIKLLN